MDRYPLMTPWTPPLIDATVIIAPQTLNLNSLGSWISAYIELPEGCNVSDIDVLSIKLNEKVSSKLEPISIGDHDNDAVHDLMVKFNRTEVIAFLMNAMGYPDGPTTVALSITGELTDGTLIKGICNVKLI